jgi:fumarylacetoacetate (FAA) hydrolase
MRLATIDNGTPDGQLVVISPDGTSYATAPVATMQHALHQLCWQRLASYSC